MTTILMVNLNKLGIVRVEMGEQGVRSLHFDRGASVSADNRHPVARLLQEYAAGDISALDKIPVELPGKTEFFRKIYREARKVPAGKTITYGELAKRAGRPKAARAVGQAMRTNPVALIVPCHRVVGSGGKLVGYNSPGGTKTKANLLRHEGAAESGWRE